MFRSIITGLYRRHNPGFWPVPGTGFSCRALYVLCSFGTAYGLNVKDVGVEGIYDVFFFTGFFSVRSISLSRSSVYGIPTGSQVESQGTRYGIDFIEVKLSGILINHEINAGHTVASKMLKDLYSHGADFFLSSGEMSAGIFLWTPAIPLEPLLELLRYLSS